MHTNKYEKHFPKLYRDVGMAVPKTTRTRHSGPLNGGHPRYNGQLFCDLIPFCREPSGQARLLASRTGLHQLLDLRAHSRPPDVRMNKSFHPAYARVGFVEFLKHLLPSWWGNNNLCSLEDAAIKHTQF